MIIERFVLICLIRSQTQRRDSTSRPEEGSSRMISLDPPISAIARLSFLFIPPESYLAYLDSCSVSITIRSVLITSFATSYLGTFLSSQTSSRCSLTVRTSNNTSNCWQRPIDFLTASISFLRFAPQIYAFPLDGLIMPVIIFKTVVLPAPL